MASSTFNPKLTGAPYLATKTDSRESLKKSYQTPQHPLDNVSSQLNGAPRARLLTVDEALQYSPLSSVIPFDSSILSTPSTDFSSPQAIFPVPAEEIRARQSLEFLNQDLLRHHGHSNVAHRAFKDLKPYIKSGSLTEIKFKPPPMPNEHSLEPPSPDDTENSRLSDSLSPFARMLLDGVDLSHRYPTPISPGTPSLPKLGTADSGVYSHGVANGLPVLHQKLAAPTPQSQNTQVFAKNAHSSKGGPNTTRADGLPLPVNNRSSKVAIIVPPLTAEATPSEYRTITEDTTRSRRDSGNVAKGGGYTGSQAVGQTRDQRILADEASRHLQEVIQDIFEAEDELQVENPGTSSGFTPLFVEAYNDHGSRVLSQSIQMRLDSALQKSISCGRLPDVPVEHLSRLQALCESAVNTADGVEIELEPSWKDDDFSQWGHRVEHIDLCLRSARTTLRIMTGGREEKELYSEELLQKILRLATSTLQSCVIPVIEARSTEFNQELFQAANLHKKEISQLLYNIGKLMVLLADLLSKVDMTESIVNTVEFFTIKLLFVENAPNEKDSTLGIQKFEVLRRTSMDIITVVFARYTEQQRSIFDEILTSLQRLPTTRQHARQFKLAAGINIQLVSALILRLVQTSACKPTFRRERGRSAPHAAPSGEMDSEDGQNLNNAEGVSEGSDEESEDSPKSHHHNTLRRLSREANQLSDNAAKTAQYVTWFLVSRAMTTPKSGDQPHRHVLDIFSEDLIAVLGQPEWPAAELLLRALLVRMIKIAENPKSNAPAKNMALELLGLMGSAISDLVASTRQAAKSLEGDDSEFSGYLRQLLDEYLDGAMDKNELLGWQGPYRAVVEYLQASGSDEAQSRSAQAYYLTQWAKSVGSGNLEHSKGIEELAIHLRRSLSTSGWVPSDRFEATSGNQNRVAYSLTVLNMDFCRQFDRVLKILLDSISSDQITVRTRSLKSVTQMLEKDPSLLDRARNVKGLIMKCASDKSSMVRDSALMLIGKCIVLRPSLEHEFCKPLLLATNDAATGVRKRSMKLLKDIYLRNPQRDLRSAISDSLLQRAKDADKGVTDLARQMVEEIWLVPFWSACEHTGADVQKQLAMQKHVALVVKTVQRGDTVSSMLSCFISELLAKEYKNAAANFKVCENIVAAAFESMLETEGNSEQLEQRAVLQTLTVFATADARLFSSEQLKYLQPYVANLSNSDDLHLFRSAVIIFRCVLPTMSSVQHQLLRDVQLSLLQSLSKLGTTELNEVAACLWTINGALNNPEKLVKLVASVLRNLQALKSTNFSDSSQKENLNRVKKYIRIAGYMGKHCDMEDRQHDFRDLMTWWKGTSVAGLIISCVYPFTSTTQPLALRADALNSIGLICQSRPFQFNQEYISKAFENVLAGGEPELQNIVLAGFRDFFARQEKQSEAKYEEATTNTKELAIGKLGASMTASDSDGASALIAQRFLKRILHIALASQDSSALTATEVIASINRQGLVHPKESGPALVALETSTNSAIAEIAFQEHRNLHQQHESMFEREYMRAINEAFNYQKDTVRDPLGYTTSPYSSKLRSMFEIINSSKNKYQKKFISGFCAKIDFDPSKLDTQGTPPAFLQFARFLMENLAFFEFARMEELLHTITSMEKIVSGTGPGLAHSINTEIFQVKVESILETPEEGAREVERRGAPENMIDGSKLRRLTTGAIILSSLWEVRTFLRRLYGLQSGQQRRDSKAKAPAKDLNKAPAKAQGVTGDRLVKAIAEKVDSLASQEAMVKQCQAFVELLSVDSEVKVASEGEEGVEGPGTPSEEDESKTPIPTSGGSRALKRKGSQSVNGTPQKRNKRGRPSVKRTTSKGAEDDSD